jgi:hypothetical protein
LSTMEGADGTLRQVTWSDKILASAVRETSRT